MLNICYFHCFTYLVVYLERGSQPSESGLVLVSEKYLPDLEEIIKDRVLRVKLFYIFYTLNQVYILKTCKIISFLNKALKIYF